MGTSADVSSPVLDPNVQAFLDALAAQGLPQVNEVPVEVARKVLRDAQVINVAKPSVDIQDLAIPFGPKSALPIRIVRPHGIAEPLPAVMYFHGGGWVLGDRDTHDRLIREIAVGAHAAVVFVDYTRSPEARYPAAIEESYAAIKWVSQNAATIRVDASRLAVAGDSSGANMATAAALLVKERGGPKIGFQTLFYPATDAGFDTASCRQFETGYFLTLDGLKWFWDQYAPDMTVRNQPTASPLRASVEQLRGLPPALVVTAECDVLRDEGEAYARKLIQAGVSVTATRYLGTIHGFVALNAIAQTAAARAALAQANNALRKAFAVA